MVERLTPAEAATQIVGLINSRPATPWSHEIEAIVARAVATGDVASNIPVHARQDDPTLAALQERLREVDRLHEAARGPADEKDWLPLRDRADAADNDLMVLSRRIFAARPIDVHNLKLRAVLAKHWLEMGDQGVQWTLPEQCPDWESEVTAHLIDGVLRFDTPPDRQAFEPVALPSSELAVFRSALAGAAEFRRANPEPEVDGPGYDAWYEQNSARMDGVWRLAETILAGKAAPLDVLTAIATHYVLDDNPELIARATDGEAHDSMATWIVARLLYAVQPSIQLKAGE
jgi:hypothetical protein